MGTISRKLAVFKISPMRLYEIKKILNQEDPQRLYVKEKDNMEKIIWR
jgi:hypothetical protein